MKGLRDIQISSESLIYQQHSKLLENGSLKPIWHFEPIRCKLCCTIFPEVFSQSCAWRPDVARRKAWMSVFEAHFKTCGDKIVSIYINPLMAIIGISGYKWPLVAYGSLSDLVNVYY